MVISKSVKALGNWRDKRGVFMTGIA